MRLIHFISILVLIAVYALVKIPGAVLLLKPYGIDLYALGDLYRYAYLSEYRDTTKFVQALPSKTDNNINLFVLGDSFTASFKQVHYQGVSAYSFANWNQAVDQQFTLQTDSAMNSVLLVTCAEKNIRLRFAKNQLALYLAKLGTTGDIGFTLVEKPLSMAEYLKKYFGRADVSDQNIQAVLFENELALRIKEIKAEFNRSVFGKIAPEVEIYSEKNMLFQKLTTDSKYIYMSSFRELEVQEEDELILGMSRLVKHYKKAGIDSVIFSFIPNPVSIVAPQFKGRIYNKLIPRLEKRIAETGAGCVSVYDSFTRFGEQVYRRGDTHWNVKGASFWLNRMNQTLASMDNK
jgi:hypothetical protein